MRYLFILLASLLFLPSFNSQSTEATEVNGQATEKETGNGLTVEEIEAIALEYGATIVPIASKQSVFQKAVAGDADAQFKLALMYIEGEGVPENIGEAVKWFRQAAEQGDADAPHNLGLMYAKGEGVPQDFVEAYAWLNIAVAQGNLKAFKTRELCKKLLDRASLAKAQKRSREYFEKYVVPFQ